MAPRLSAPGARPYFLTTFDKPMICSVLPQKGWRGLSAWGPTRTALFVLATNEMKPVQD